MIACTNCGRNNADSSRFCDECGSKLIRFDNTVDAQPVYVPPTKSPVSVSASHSASSERKSGSPNGGEKLPAGGAMNATLTLERGGKAGAEFKIAGSEAIIGRWDADNGVFPDVDLDTHDQEAKVSRRHARIKMNDGKYVVEDLGSTNGTYVNRGRRLIPGMPQPISSGDELIVGKTFLRFRVNDD